MEAISAMSAMEMFQVASTAFSAIGAISQGNAKSEQYDAQANANAYNASVMRQNADIARQQGNANEETQRRRARQVLGNQRAAVAEADIGTEGTGSDLVGQSASNAEMDALNIRYNAHLQDVGFLNEANLQDWYGTQARRNASSAQTAGWMNAGTAVLSGLGGYVRRSTKTTTTASSGLG